MVVSLTLHFLMDSPTSVKGFSLKAPGDESAPKAWGCSLPGSLGSSWVVPVGQEKAGIPGISRWPEVWPEPRPAAPAASSSSVSCARRGPRTVGAHVPGPATHGDNDGISYWTHRYVDILNIPWKSRCLFPWKTRVPQVPPAVLTEPGDGSSESFPEPFTASFQIPAQPFPGSRKTQVCPS